MERFLWLLTYFPARASVLCLAFGDFFALSLIESEYDLANWVTNHTLLFYVIIAMTIICSIAFAIVGGKLGYKYVELQRSRHWHYRATSYAARSNRLHNTFYWAGKFALIPIAWVMFVFFLIGCAFFLKNL